MIMLVTSSPTATILPVSSQRQCESLCNDSSRRGLACALLRPRAMLTTAIALRRMLSEIFVSSRVAGGERKRSVSAPRSALDRISSFPRPRQQFVETVDRVSVDHAGERVMQIGVGLDVIKLAGFNQRKEHSPSMAAPL